MSGNIHVKKITVYEYQYIKDCSFFFFLIYRIHNSNVLKFNYKFSHENDIISICFQYSEQKKCMIFKGKYNSYVIVHMKVKIFVQKYSKSIMIACISI